MVFMDVSLRGINQITKTLASGKRITYYYAWKGGPRLTGEPGSAEFIESYLAVTKFRPARAVKVLTDLINSFTSSEHFEGMKDGSKYQMLRRLRKVKETFGELPLTAFEDRRTLEVLETWRARIAERSASAADLLWGALSAMLTWAVRRGFVKTNLCAGGGYLYNGTRVDKVWSEQQVERFCASAPSHLVIALMLALWSGQREGSLVKLRWSAYDGSYLTVQQEKNKRGQPPKIVVVPVRGPFKEFLDKVELEAGVVGLSLSERDERYILLNSNGRRWGSPASFSNAFGSATEKLGIEDRTFHDLRGTAVTRLARAGCTVPQIATITGHSLKTVQAILDKHYLHRDLVLAEQAMEKRVAYEVAQLSAQLAQIDE